jgi:iron complex transport system substrate-binding protein
MTRKTSAAIIAGLSLLLTACGSDDGDSATTTDEMTAAPDEMVTTTVAAATTDPPVEPESAAPAAIVSLSPTATEMLYAVGAGDQVIAVDDFSNYPSDTADKQPGISGYDPNVEAILALGADLIVTDGTNPDLIDAIERAGVAHWAGPAAVTIDDTVAQILEIGEATGHAEEALALVSDMEAELAMLMERIEALPELDRPLTYYHELDNTYYSVTSETFIGSTYSMLGLRNIADLAEGESYGYPQLSAEFILDKNPDLIFLACTIYCGETPESVAARPGWDALSAVEAGHVFGLDDDTASRWGPRIVDHMTTVVDAVEAVVGAQAE